MGLQIKVAAAEERDATAPSGIRPATGLQSLVSLAGPSVTAFAGAGRAGAVGSGSGSGASGDAATVPCVAGDATCAIARDTEVRGPPATHGL